MIDGVKDSINDTKSKVVKAVDDAEIGERVSDIGDAAVGKAKELGDVASETAHDVAVKMDETSMGFKEIEAYIYKRFKWNAIFKTCKNCRKR